MKLFELFETKTFHPLSIDVGDDILVRKFNLFEKWNDYTTIGHHGRGALLYYMMPGGKIETLVSDGGNVHDVHWDGPEAKAIAVGRIDPETKKISVRPPVAVNNFFDFFPNSKLKFIAKTLKRKYPDYEIWYFGNAATDIRRIDEKDDTYQPPSINVGDDILLGRFKNKKAKVTGFKKDDNNQPVLKTTKGDTKLFKPRIPKLMEITKKDAGDILQNAGYKHIGTGNFATVWAKPNEKTILKLFDNNDIGFLRYIDFCRQNSDNPHFPKFSRRIVNLGKYNAIRTERLKEWKNDEADLFLRHVQVYIYLATDRFPAQISNFILRMNDEQYEKSIQSMKQWMEENPSVKDACDRMLKFLNVGGNMFDLEPDNIMIRDDGTPVFIDPVWEVMISETMWDKKQYFGVYTWNGCGRFALALAKLYPGGMIYIITPIVYDENEDEMVSTGEVRHVFYKVNGKTVDVKGIRSPSVMASDVGLKQGEYEIEGPYKLDVFNIGGTWANEQEIKRTLEDMAPYMSLYKKLGVPKMMNERYDASDHSIETMRDRYNYGRCMYLALALHDMFGWKIRGEIANDRYVHIWAVNPQGKAVDINGVHSGQDITHIDISRSSPKNKIVDIDPEELRASHGTIEQAERIVRANPEHFGVKLNETAPKTQNPQFKAWFRKSKAVKNGQPMVFYHGTTKEFRAFDPKYSNTQHDMPAAFFFTDKPDVAQSYAGQKTKNFHFDKDSDEQDYRRAAVGNEPGDFDRALDILKTKARRNVTTWDQGAHVMPVYLRMEKPLRASGKGNNWNEIEFEGETLSTKDLLYIAKERGCDSIIIKNIHDRAHGKGKPSTIVAVFSPDQIKSALTNKGNYSGQNIDEAS